MAVLIIAGAFLCVREDFEGFVCLLEFILGLFVVGVTIRVMLHRHATIGLLEIRLCGIAGHTQYFVVISFGHNLLLCLCCVNVSRKVLPILLSVLQRKKPDRGSHPVFCIASPACHRPRLAVTGYHLSSLTSSNSASTASSLPVDPPCSAPPPVD